MQAQNERRHLRDLKRAVRLEIFCWALCCFVGVGVVVLARVGPCWPMLARVGPCQPVLVRVGRKWVPSWLLLAQVCFQLAPSWPMSPHFSRWALQPKLLECWLEGLARNKWARVGPSWPQVGTKLAHVGFCCPKLASSWPQVNWPMAGRPHREKRSKVSDRVL